MAEAAATNVSPLETLVLASGPTAIHISEPGAQMRFVYRGGVRALKQALDVDAAAPINRASGGGPADALRLGPDEWLVLGSEESGESVLASIRAALTPGEGCVVDISDRNVTLLISGSRCEDLLASGCPLDFDVRSFPVGMCTRTIFGKVEVVMWRTGPLSFRLETARSFAPYLTDLLSVCIKGLPDPH